MPSSSQSSVDWLLIVNLNETLNDAIRNLLVVGLHSKNIQKRLLAQKTLNFADSCEIARSMEAADCDIKSMHEGGIYMNQV